jgi:hypothetical protein
MTRLYSRVGASASDVKAEIEGLVRGGRKFSDLPQNLQNYFSSYQLGGQVGGYYDDKIKEMPENVRVSYKTEIDNFLTKEEIKVLEKVLSVRAKYESEAINK